jgi:hypothetical protein
LRNDQLWPLPHASGNPKFQSNPKKQQKTFTSIAQVNTNFQFNLLNNSFNSRQMKPKKRINKKIYCCFYHHLVRDELKNWFNNDVKILIKNKKRNSFFPFNSIICWKIDFHTISCLFNSIPRAIEQFQWPLKDKVHWDFC